jgi:hypothetical protein
MCRSSRWKDRLKSEALYIIRLIIPQAHYHMKGVSFFRQRPQPASRPEQIDLGPSLMDLARPQTLIDKGLGIDPAVKKKLSWLKSGLKYLF